MPNVGTVGLLVMLALVAVTLAGLVHAATRPASEWEGGAGRRFWLGIQVLFPGVGSVIYFFTRRERRSRRQPTEQNRPGVVGDTGAASNH